MSDGLFEVHEFAARQDGLVEIHAFPFRKYTHPKYGELNFTPEDAKEMKENFDNKVLEHDVAWDYAHKKDMNKGDKAAGWVEAVEVRDDGAWVLMKPTETARNEIEKGEWKYSSMTRLPEWTNNTTGETFKNVLYGGGLTNHPFLKGVAPLNFEDFDYTLKTHTENHKEDSTVDIKDLAVKLGLPENATQEQIDAQMQLFADSHKTVTEAEAEKARLAQEEVDKTKKAASEVTQEFGDLPPAVVAELIKGKELRLKIEAQEFADGIVVEEGKAITPAAKEKARDSYLALLKGDSTPQEFAAVMSEVNSAKGIVDLSEIGSSANDKQSEDDIREDRVKAQEFSDKVGALAWFGPEADRMSEGDAIAKVEKEHPELAQAYRNITIGGGVS